MAYVVPNSEAQFFVGTNLSPSHENSLYFASISDKDSYFDSWNKYSVSSVTYQRENRGYIRVELSVSSLIRCDYMRFRNNSFENQWFYAFITEVNYINNITTEVRYELDPLMTWMGWFSLKRCYVARQHTVNDGIGNNICEEGIPVGPYITEAVGELGAYYGSNCFYRVTVADNEQSGLGSVGGIPTGCSTYDCSTQTQLFERINTLVEDNKADSIVGIFVVPTVYEGGVQTVQLSHGKPYSDIDGYVPKNNKLFCYPYKYLTLDNGEGSTQDFKYEYFNTTPSSTSSGNFTFHLKGCNYATGCQVAALPYDYNGVSGLNSEFRMTQTHFPQGAYAVDSYEAYLAQKNAYFPQEQAIRQRQSDTNAIKSAVTGSAGALQSGNLIGALTGALGDAAQSYTSTATDMQNAVTENLTINEIRPESPDIMHGTPSTDIMYSYEGKKMYYYEKSITRNYAQMIDDYFTMYGYAVKQVMTPNMNARPHWTYVKTIGCNAEGQFPAQDARAIENIFDNGVRFWHNLTEIGNYSLDNSPS